MMKISDFYLESIIFENLTLSVVINRGILFSAIFYVMCTVVRLARFNVENDADEAAHMNFIGLPSPAAAGAVVSLIVFYIQFLSGIAAFQTIMVIGLPLTTFCAGILMVSRIRYPHLPNQLLRVKKPLPSLLLIFACGIFIVWNIQLALLVGFCSFMLFGVFRSIFQSIFKKSPQPQA
jgi:phosphatidylserine synthase